MAVIAPRIMRGFLEQTLSDRTLQLFACYEAIVTKATMAMKLFSMPLGDKSGLLKEGGLTETVLQLVPSAKDGFDKWGENYAYHWAGYFYDETLKALRHEVSGEDDLISDVDSIQSLALTSRQAQINVANMMQTTGVPEALAKTVQEDASH